MCPKEVFSPYNEDIKGFFKDPQDMTFFVGAGISIDAPSNLLPAKLFTKNLLEMSAVAAEVDSLLKLNELRYEMIVEIIQRYFDQQLEFMDYFEEFKQPNLIHYFLAQCIQHGSIVSTTNFDYLIEHALLNTVPKDKQSHIVPVISPKEFERNKNPKALVDAGKFAIYKLHGAKRNIITKMQTTDSLMTSLSALGKGTTILALDPNKEECLKTAIIDHTLVVMGYSGSDDFDISPLFRQMFNLKRLIWIDHVQSDQTQVFEFDPKAAFVLPKGLSKSERFLAEVCSNTEAQVIMIKTNTSKFTQDVLWPALLAATPKPVLPTESPSKPKPLKEWLQTKFSEIPEVVKWKSTCDLYYELGYNSEFFRCAQIGLKIAEEKKSEKMQSEFINLLGIYYFRAKDYDKAQEYYQKALKLAEDSGNQYLIGTRKNNLGLVYFERGQYDLALQYFKEALELGKMRGDHDGIASRLSNIGLVYIKQQRFAEAKTMFTEALKVDEKTGNLLPRSIHLKNLGDLAQAQKDLTMALDFYQKAYQIVQKLGDLRNTGAIMIEIAKIYHELGDIGKAINNVKKAIEYLKAAEDTATLKEAELVMQKIKANLK